MVLRVRFSMREELGLPVLEEAWESGDTLARGDEPDGMLS